MAVQKQKKHFENKKIPLKNDDVIVDLTPVSRKPYIFRL